jgi:hypothetical protein
MLLPSHNSSSSSQKKGRRRNRDGIVVGIIAGTRRGRRLLIPLLFGIVVGFSWIKWYLDQQQPPEAYRVTTPQHDSLHAEQSSRSQTFTAAAARQQQPGEEQEAWPKVIKTTDTALLRNKTLVILIGDLRCGEPAWQSLAKQVLDYNAADLALFTHPPEQIMYQHSSLLDRSIHTEMVPNYTDWSIALDLINNGDDSWRHAVQKYFPPTSHGHVLGGLPGYQASGVIVNSYKWFVLQTMKRLGWITHYDRFVVTRTDQYYPCPLDLSKLDNAYVWVPTGEDWKGITDRFVIFGADRADAALDTIAPFLRDPQSFRKVLPNQSYYLNLLVGWQWYFPNCEQFLLRMWEHNGLAPHFIRRFPRTMYSCMHPQRDKSRWGVSKGFAKQHQVHYKYDQEYAAAVRTCPAVRATAGRWRAWLLFE